MDKRDGRHLSGENKYQDDKNVNHYVYLHACQGLAKSESIRGKFFLCHLMFKECNFFLMNSTIPTKTMNTKYVSSLFQLLYNVV